MLGYAVLLLAGLSAISGLPQRQQRGYSSNTTPVPILRQINTHNDDGSYTYGYEGGDGSYKIENKAANGVVTGKYGYYDDVGQLREIEYGANKNGFVPTGTGINVPPPVASTNTNGFNNPSHDSSDDSNDGQYNPAQYETPYEYRPEQLAQQTDSGNFNFAPQQQQLQQPIFQQRQPSRARVFNNNNINQGSYYQAPAQQQQQYTTYNQPAAPAFASNANLFQGHPATNINLNSGSYSVNY